MAMTTIAPVQELKGQRLRLLRELERKVLWLSAWTVHHANHIRPNRDGIKVGGHQASCASLATVMTALYFSVLRPEDRVAVKPHASPVFHAIQYLFGNQTRDKLERFRAMGGAQSYPSRTKDVDDVDFSTGSVGLGVAMTLFASLVQDYVRLKNLGDAERPASQQKTGRMVALVGDAELDEGNIFEALLEGWKHDVRNLWWVIDYNRQSLDGVVNDRLFGRIGEMFELVGWRVVTLKYGKLLETAFAQPDGDHLRQWIDDCPNSLYSALVFKGGAGWREALTRDLNQYPGIRRILEQHDDAALHRLLTNLAGNDMQAVLDAFEGVLDDQPTCFIAYTIKGQGLPFAGHKDNHSGLMTLDQMASFKKGMTIEDGQEWDKFAGLSAKPDELQAFIAGAPFNTAGRRRTEAPVVAIPAALPRPTDKKSSTQEGFGKILNAIAAEDSELARRIVTTSPDVTVSTNLGPWVNRRGLWAHTEAEDVFRELKVVSAQLWRKTPRGQHLELGIAENNLFIQLAAMGLSHQPAADRHALRSLHQPRPRCAELCLLPGCALHDRGHAVGRDPVARRRRASEHPYAADRHRPARIAELRAGLCRRARGAYAARAGLHAAGQGRLGLSPTVDAQPAAAAAHALARAGSRHRVGRLLVRRARSRCRHRHRRDGRRDARGDRGA
jgi:pyruvate dehydrogenase E1 component